ncbi:DUF2092 domain-containing protein [Thermodesulfobacteriota bacterium]
MNTKATRRALLLGAAMLRWAMVPARWKDEFLKKRATRLTALAVGLALGFGLAAGPAMSEDGIGPDADKILRSMSTYLGGLSAFNVNADIDIEIIDLAGQKLQLSSYATIVIERPGKLKARRLGAFADTELIFDGKVLTLYGKSHNIYFQIGSPGTIDDAFQTMRDKIGLSAPGADLLYADPYPSLASGIVSGAYLGTVYVNGVECHYLAFREAKVDWQLWVKAGDAPLPMKYVIITKWVIGAPQYSVRFRDWNTKPRIEANRFEFSAPEGARRLEIIQVNEMGQLMIEEVQ